ncbi:hypothetical protein TYRP_010105 [Tyrophagus putrescentiae]|nr:hypothetical protein TYRP_010105 [Tyrophagus putrescentiae]
MANLFIALTIPVFSVLAAPIVASSGCPCLARTTSSPTADPPNSAAPCHIHPPTLQLSTDLSIPTAVQAV